MPAAPDLSAHIHIYIYTYIYTYVPIVDRYGLGRRKRVVSEPHSVVRVAAPRAVAVVSNTRFVQGGDHFMTTSLTSAATAGSSSARTQLVRSAGINENSSETREDLSAGSAFDCF